MRLAGRWSLAFVMFLLIALRENASDLITVGTNGNAITWQTPPGYCCVYVTLDAEVTQSPCSIVSSCSTAAAKSNAFTCNRVGTHAVEGCLQVDSGPERICETKLVTVIEPPPPSCPIFTLAAKGATVLTHKYAAEDMYPPGQTTNAQIEILLRPISVDAATTLYAKVFDPPDTAPYRTSRHRDDNYDGAGGKLALSASDSGAPTVSFSVPATGSVKLFLNSTTFASGDNYEVKVSADASLLTNPEFSCGDTCATTGIITAWKRAYLEKKRMFRAGGLVVGDAPAAQNEVRVQVPTGVKFSPGMIVRLVHAPRLDGGDLYSDFHFEDAEIAPHGVDRIARKVFLLTFTAPLQYGYSEDDSPSVNGIADGISDGVGILASGFYERNEQYANDAFAPAFVELSGLSQQNDAVPYVPVLKAPLHFANKWFEHSPVIANWRAGDPNVKHVLAGTGEPDPNSPSRIFNGTLGATLVTAPGSLPTPNACWTYARAIENAVRDSGSPIWKLDPWLVNGETTVHELAHTWSVNYVTPAPPADGGKGHCTQVMALHPAEACTMSRANAGHHSDGIVGFHWVSDLDSEYMTMRWMFEPIMAP